MDRDDAIAMVAFGFFWVAGFGCFALANNWLGQQACSSRWRDSGLPWRYEMQAGCLVRLPSGQWVHESAVKFQR